MYARVSSTRVVSFLPPSQFASHALLPTNVSPYTHREENTHLRASAHETTVISSISPLPSQPLVSTANVPQLSADLLIQSLDLQCIGVFDPQYLVPAIGGRDDDIGVTSPLECTCGSSYESVRVRA